MSPCSKVLLAAFLAAGLLAATPARAQQPSEEANPFGLLIEGVRGFFGMMFSGAEQKPEEPPQVPATPAPPAPAQAPAQSPPTAAI